MRRSQAEEKRRQRKLQKVLDEAAKQAEELEDKAAVQRENTARLEFERLKVEAATKRRADDAAKKAKVLSSFPSFGHVNCEIQAVVIARPRTVS